MTVVRVLFARCENVDEESEAVCPGRLRFTWGVSEAPCDLCGARCGVAVAKWEGVVLVEAEHNHLNSGLYGGCPACGTVFCMD